MCAGVVRVGFCCGDLSGFFFWTKKVSQACRGVEVYVFECQGTSTYDTDIDQIKSMQNYAAMVVCRLLGSRGSMVIWRVRCHFRSLLMNNSPKLSDLQTRVLCTSTFCGWNRLVASFAALSWARGHLISQCSYLVLGYSVKQCRHVVVCFRISALSTLYMRLPARARVVMSALFQSLYPVLPLLFICLPDWVVMSALFGSMCSHALNSFNFGSLCSHALNSLHVSPQLGWWCPPFSSLCALSSLHLSPSQGNDAMLSILTFV